MVSQQVITLEKLWLIQFTTNKALEHILVMTLNKTTSSRFIGNDMENPQENLQRWSQRIAI